MKTRLALLLVTGLLIFTPNAFADPDPDSYVFIAALDASAQQGGKAGDRPPPVVFTTQQDHQNMLDQLEITKLRPGRSANADASNAANYDEAKANPYPELPAVLETDHGEKVTTAEQWWKTRRPQIVKLLETEVYGRIPANVPVVKWEVRQTREVEAGGMPAIQKQLMGIVDNSACPDIQVNISMSLTLPKEAEKPVPVLISFGWTPFEMERFNFGGFRRPGNRPRPRSKRDMLIAAGWGCATLNPSTVQDDSRGRNTHHSVVAPPPICPSIRTWRLPFAPRD